MLRQLLFPEYAADINSSSKLVNRASQQVFLPEECPRCFATLSPVILQTARVNDQLRSPVHIVTLYCPKCNHSFLAEYSEDSPVPLFVGPRSMPEIQVDPKISALSPGFATTFSQAKTAEALQLTEIAGMGYRKALEYLIKDYLIANAPADADAIKREFLGNCINNRIDNANIQTAARGATWLGNDFTHYDRRYSEYDLSHLKTFIQAVQYWILMEITTSEAGNMDRR